MKLKNRFYSMAVLIMIVGLFTACGLTRPVGTPVRAGSTVEVGGWSNATSTMEGYDVTLVVSAGMNNSGWKVTVLGANPSADGIRLDLEIKNNMEIPGAIDLIKGPTLIDQQGSKILPSMVNLGHSYSVPFLSSGTITDTVACSFSTPDSNGIQAAACDLILAVTKGKVLLAVGAGKTVQVSVIFSTPATSNRLVMEWQDGTRFAVP